jgi:hypothetical protein
VCVSETQADGNVRAAQTHTVVLVVVVGPRERERELERARCGACHYTLFND